MRTALKSAAMVFVIMTAVTPVLGADFHVTKTADTNDGACTPGDCSLREAVIAANASPDADTIHIPAGTYIILIPGYEDAAATGDLDITGPVTLVGAGMKDTIITAAGELGIHDRVFHIIAPGHHVRFEKLGIWGGYKFPDVGGGVFIEKSGRADFFQCHFYRNFAGAGGGIGIGIDVFGTQLFECVVEKNESGVGGGIFTKQRVRQSSGRLSLTTAPTLQAAACSLLKVFSGSKIQPFIKTVPRSGLK